MWTVVAFTSTDYVRTVLLTILLPEHFAADFYLLSLLSSFTEESEMVGIVSSALNTEGETGNLVEVKFQKTPSQVKKYLEAEPKALGVCG